MLFRSIRRLTTTALHGLPRDALQVRADGGEWPADGSGDAAGKPLLLSRLEHFLEKEMALLQEEWPNGPPLEAQLDVYRQCLQVCGSGQRGGGGEGERESEREEREREREGGGGGEGEGEGGGWRARARGRQGEGEWRRGENER